MKKLHEVSDVHIAGTRMSLVVDEQALEVDLSLLSNRLASASEMERRIVEVSPAGYGMHWPLIDEDITINGIINQARKAEAVSC